MTRVLTTGAASGLGKYLFEHFGGVGLTRQTPREEFEAIRRAGVDVIIHCAANASRDVDLASLGPYVEDNVLFTEKLVAVPHRKFIFCSSVDVYPKDGRRHREDEPILLDAAKGLYAMTKLMSEAIVGARSPNRLIFRFSGLLGPYARRNTVMKLIAGGESAVGLSGDSVVNCVRHADVLDFLRLAFERDLTGTYNVAAAANISIAEIAAMFGREARFGSYRYDVGDIDNGKAASLLPVFQRSSAGIIREFAAAR